MPQVITLVRGTTTVTGNGTSNATLFTSSGTGIAARVIVNQLTVTSATASATDTNIHIYNNGSGTAESMIGGVKLPTGVTRLSLVPSQSIAGGLSGANTSGALFIAGTLPATSIGFQAPAFNTTGYNLCPTSFWIGPNDNIRARVNWYSGGGKVPITAQTVTIAYSFTLITET